MNNGKYSIPTSCVLSDIYQERRENINQKSVGTDSLLDNNMIKHEVTSLESNRLSGTGHIGGISKVPLLNADHFDSVVDIVEVEVPPSSEKNPVDFGEFFQEGYCKVSEPDGCRKLTEDVSDDVDNGDSHCEREKSESDGEEDEMLGGMFDFSEEG